MKKCGIENLTLLKKIQFYHARVRADISIFEVNRSFFAIFEIFICGFLAKMVRTSACTTEKILPPKTYIFGLLPENKSRKSVQ